MSGFLFVLVMDWVMRWSVKIARTGIWWKMTTMPEDFDFTDDLALISSTFTQIHIKIDHLNRNGKGMGLKISTKKTKVMRININKNNAVVIDGQKMWASSSAICLGNLGTCELHLVLHSSTTLSMTQLLGGEYSFYNLLWNFASKKSSTLLRKQTCISLHQSAEAHPPLLRK